LTLNKVFNAGFTFWRQMHVLLARQRLEHVHLNPHFFPFSLRSETMYYFSLDNSVATEEPSEESLFNQLAASFAKFVMTQGLRNYCEAKRRWLRMRCRAGVPRDPTVREGDHLTRNRITPELEQALSSTWRRLVPRVNGN
jgi:hypothetical protein